MSHRNPDGGFRNPWPDSESRRLSDAFRWWLNRSSGDLPPDPDPSAFPLVMPAFRAPRAPSDVLTVTWVGHAATLLQIGGKNVLTDPMFGDRASPVSFAGPRRRVAPGIALSSLPPIDAVLLSHNHYDHLDLGTARVLAERFPKAPWIAPLGLARLLGRTGVREVHELDWWDSVAVDGLSVTATPAKHFSARGPFDRNRSLWCGFALGAGGRRVFFAGDTGYHPEFEQIGERCGPFDLMLIPIGAYDPRWFMRPIHMNPEEAVRAFVKAGGAWGGVMVGIHWGTFKLTDEPLDEPPRRAALAWAAAGLPSERLWLPKHGETLEVE